MLYFVQILKSIGKKSYCSSSARLATLICLCENKISALLDMLMRK
ncbi:Uncharacterized protein dnm_047200 [Desulfonema magnum]|uniref:Uncharacterized protein n=1 Tax=Desulfonema magnum TaxID=45655 RepID=A0A975BND1_9BACT|nr:Uncharacterized protein dnm_047200 [Desulfonema magnum]